MPRLRPATLLTVCGLLALAGCPDATAPPAASPAQSPTGEGLDLDKLRDQTRAESQPTSQPTSQATGGAADRPQLDVPGLTMPEAGPGSRPTSQPQIKLGGQVLFDAHPSEVAAVSSAHGIRVTLTRAAVLPADGERLSQEPVDVKGLAAPGKFVLILELDVEVDGQPWTEVEDDKSVALVAVGLGMGLDEKSGVPRSLFLEGGFPSKIPGRPAGLYLCQYVTPFPPPASPLTVRTVFEVDYEDSDSLDLPPIDVTPSGD